MTASFRITPNNALGGDTLSLEPQGFTKPSQFKGKTFLLRIFEIDQRQDKGRPKSDNDLLAEFQAGIVDLGTRDKPNLRFDKVTRTDSLPAEFPLVEPRKTTEGQGLSFKPDWKPPHFYLRFPLESGFTVSTLILIRGEAHELERYVFEIGFQVLESGKTVFHSTLMPTSLDCNHLLSHNCVQATLMLMSDHQEMVHTRGIGLRYGVKCDYATLQADKAAYDLKVSSCITYQAEAVELGHIATSAVTDWKRIESFMKKGKGTLLFKGFVDAGWVGVYYNPDTRHPADWDNEHTASARIVNNSSSYYEIQVHDSLVDYRPTLLYEDGTPIPTAKVTLVQVDKLAKLKSVPFAVILARGGQHTAILMSGRIYEVHWKHGPRDEDLYESKDFETEWDWLSGMIMIPHGLWT